MLTTGNQLRAGRSLAGVDQFWIAQAAGIAVNTVRNMEACGAEQITSSAANVRAVEKALSLVGVECTNGGKPGVQLHFVEARAHVRDTGEKAVAIRWREGSPLTIVALEEAERLISIVEKKGDNRVRDAIRAALDQSRER
jgi:hypothetical protein